MENKTELYIYNNANKKTYAPIIKDKITWTTERKGVAGKLTFTVVKDSKIDFNEGSSVIFKYNNQNVFFGYVFTKSRDKEHHIQVTAYDQLRYLKNKHTYVYENKSANEIVGMIASDFLLKTGTLQNTKYKIPSKIEDNSTLFDIIQNALDVTLLNTKQLFVLYDDFGALTLKNSADMLIDKSFTVCDTTAQNFDYKTSIDDKTYNRIQLYIDDQETNQRQFTIEEDIETISRWGILQLTEKLNDNENAKAKAQTMLKLYNQAKRTLTVKDIFGNVKARAGSSVYTQLNLGDILLNGYMLVEKAKHEFSDNEYTMTLDLYRSDFGATN